MMPYSFRLHKHALVHTAAPLHFDDVLGLDAYLTWKMVRRYIDVTYV
jgi:hypothetical protein